MKKLFHILFFFLLVTPICFAQWYLQNSGTTNSLLGVSFTDANIGTVVGSGGTILRTTNGGTDWTAQASGTTWDLNAVNFVNKDYGWIAGDMSLALDSGIIIRTTNGGIEWTSQMVSHNLYGIDFVDSLVGWAVGMVGTILKTTDGGVNWLPQTSGTTNAFRDVFFVDALVGWSVGGYFSNLIRKTTDGGLTWFEQTSSSSQSFWSIHATDDLHAWAAEVTGNVYKTTDGGSNWLQRSTGTTTSINSVFFVNDQIGWAGGGNYIYESGMYKTTDAGETWNSQSVPTNNQIASVYFIDSQNGWAVGIEGTILHTSNGGVSFVEEEVLNEMPTEFLLSQNYPNPFNPSTKIKYSVPHSSNVTIKVFDILGNEIETLVNEEKAVGTYEITWYAANLPSGIYFYQLKAGDPSSGSGQGFIETKKMILLK
jgi:photosystem II stability/assembly factor-like uncharacterized protein